uniref:SH2 domain-containing protein n=1 Tax=Heterorhabditis bacteriophora TaxID=37862 RepID=A0A1I7WM81_HETBA
MFPTNEIISSRDDHEESSASQPVSSSKLQYFVGTSEANGRPWYHGEISNSEAEELLFGCPPGQYLVRKDGPTKYYLSCVADDNTISHLPIRQLGRRFYFMGEKFVSLSDLVRYYSEVVEAAEPIHAPFAHSSCSTSATFSVSRRMIIRTTFVTSLSEATLERFMSISTYDGLAENDELSTTRGDIISGLERIDDSYIWARNETTGQIGYLFAETVVSIVSNSFKISHILIYVYDISGVILFKNIVYSTMLIIIVPRVLGLRAGAVPVMVGLHFEPPKMSHIGVLQLHIDKYRSETLKSDGFYSAYGLISGIKFSLLSHPGGGKKGRPFGMSALLPLPDSRPISDTPEIGFTFRAIRYRVKVLAIEQYMPLIDYLREGPEELLEWASDALSAQQRALLCTSLVSLLLSRRSDLLDLISRLVRRVLTTCSAESVMRQDSLATSLVTQALRVAGRSQLEDMLEAGSIALIIKMLQISIYNSYNRIKSNCKTIISSIFLILNISSIYNSTFSYTRKNLTAVLFNF